MNSQLDQSYRICERTARRTATNFYYCFLLLPRAKRRSMSALYTFLRHTDDLGDNPQPADWRRTQLQRWRASLDEAMAGRFDSPVLPALVDTVVRYRVPLEYLHAVIDGVEMDLGEVRHATFDDLERYCYHVASVVGLACIHIWGFRGQQALEPARRCGVAFQLTNILRDLKEDALAQRVYLPTEDLERFDYTADELRRGVRDSRFKNLMRYEIARTERYYQDAAQLEPWLEPDGRRIFRAMLATYHGLLDEIRRIDGDVFGHRVRLSSWRKLRIATQLLVLPPPSTIVRVAGDRR